MASPIWQLGPAGDLRPLVCPEGDFDITEERFGGVFQSLSGARSMTNTGLRQRFTMDLRFLTEPEYAWMEALHRRYIPGPFRLISPFKKNLLTGSAAMCEDKNPAFFGKVSYQGMTPSSGVITRTRDWPSAAGVFGAMSSKWTLRAGGTQILRWDDSYKTPVKPGVQYTASVFTKASAAGTGWMVIDWFDVNHVQLSGTAATSTAMTTSWQRGSWTGTAPANAALAQMAFYSTAAVDISVAAAQFEVGAAPTSWDAGGGALVVLMDQMTTTTPRFPYRTVNISLLEA